MLFNCKTFQKFQEVNDHSKYLKGGILFGENQTCLTMEPILKVHLLGQCSVQHQILN